MMKGERMAKRSSFGSIVRKRLSDITNSQSQPKLISQEENQLPISNPTEDMINQLLKEKASLMKLVEDRDKVIAISDNQLRNLRLHYQKLQLQNWSLAQSNSQMLAELNLGRERVKALQHELVCKDALLKAKYSMSKGKTEIKDEINGSQEGDKKNAVDNKTDRIRRRITRSQSMGPSTTSRHGVEKEKLENKRRCLRRQSDRFKSEPKENLFEIEIAEPVVDGVVLSSSVIKEETCDLRNKTQTRCSLGRPVRRAAEKVQSYRETPVNVKMRREA
ncbi:SHUGOSHIN 2 [Euphorbia lathyris]|uniref:SHUGOSHIN 2 n=1 Tax=Euphorbia lathyris TaxID=212925 RepID=UPI0033144EF8